MFFFWFRFLCADFKQWTTWVLINMHAYLCSVQAFDTDCVEKGSLFEIPVTIVQPHVIDYEETRLYEPISHTTDGSFEFQPSTIKRDFILVPPRATWAGEYCV